MNIFYLAGITITFFLALMLLAKKGKTAADYVLAVWLSVIGFHLFLFYLHITNGIYEYPLLLGIHLPMPLLQGPLLYIYVLTETRYNGFRKSYWLHFAPAIISYIALSGFFRLSDSERIAVYKNGGAGFEAYTNPILIALTISGFVYVLLSFYELHRYRKRITNEFSNTEKINLNWLRYLIYGILAIWLFVLFRANDAVIFGVVVVFVLLLGYFGIQHVGIFSYQKSLIPQAVNKDHTTQIAEIQASQTSTLREPAQEQAEVIRKEVMEEQEPEPGESKSKYERSGLQTEAAEKIYADLQCVMQKEKLFKESELSLSLLADRLTVHPNNLSQVINTYQNKNFYDYINTLRIEEFKKLASLPENRRYTLLSLAFECGFNSKTAFNRNFKKSTGQSPSKYLKEAQIQLQ